MITIDLNQEEQVLLADLLGTCIDELRAEIAHTDRMDYKERLKERRAVLMKLRDLLLQSQEAMGL